MAMVAQAMAPNGATRETPLGARPCRSRFRLSVSSFGIELPAQVHEREDGMGRSPREMAASFHWLLLHPVRLDRIRLIDQPLLASGFSVYVRYTKISEFSPHSSIIVLKDTFVTYKGIPLDIS